MILDSHLPWTRELLVPAFFTVLGAGLGLAVNQLQDNRKATRAKRSFLRAVGMELDGLDDQLDVAMCEVKESTEALEQSSIAPGFVIAPRTSVFGGQIGKLRDVDDELVIELIHFYSDLRVAEKTIETLNGRSAEYDRAAPEQKGDSKKSVAYLVTLLQEQLVDFRIRLRTLRDKLP